MKDAIYGMQTVHAKQFQQGHIWEGAAPFRTEPPVSADELTAIAAEAFNDACLLQAWISVDLTREEAEVAVNEWWGACGQALIVQRFRKSDTAEADEDLMFDDALLDLEEAVEEQDPACPSEATGENPEQLLDILESRHETILALEQAMPAAVQDIPGAPSCQVPAQPHEPELPKPCHTSSDDVVGSFSLIKAQVMSETCFAVGTLTKQSAGKEACLRRLRVLHPFFKEFVSTVRVAEGILWEPQFLLYKEKHGKYTNKTTVKNKTFFKKELF